MKVTQEFVFFWGKDDVFSNFYHAPFEHQGITFIWSEQAVMFRKAMLFGAGTIAETIRLAPTPQVCKQLGRSRDIPFDEAVWAEHRERIYYEVLLDKFTSNQVLKQALLDTKGKVLAEASPYDKIWGIGLKENDPRAMYPNQWRGLNLLGRVLMKVREDI